MSPADIESLTPKPPLGVEPEWNHRTRRMEALARAISDRLDYEADTGSDVEPIVHTWIGELHKLSVERYEG